MRRYHILGADEPGDKYTDDMDKKLKGLGLEVLKKLDNELEGMRPKKEANKDVLLKKLSSTSLVNFLIE